MSASEHAHGIGKLRSVRLPGTKFIYVSHAGAGRQIAVPQSDARNIDTRSARAAPPV